MIYKFKCKAAGDVIMLEPHGDQLLRLLGREPAAQGHHRSRGMPAAIAALEAGCGASASSRADGADGERGVGLTQRAWPMIEMMKRSHAAGEPIVWGV